MGWCKIGEKDGAKAIADLILFNTSLTTLDLRGNGLGNSGETLLFVHTSASPRLICGEMALATLLKHSCSCTRRHVSQMS